MSLGTGGGLLPKKPSTRATSAYDLGVHARGAGALPHGARDISRGGEASPPPAVASALTASPAESLVGEVASVSMVGTLKTSGVQIVLDPIFGLDKFCTGDFDSETSTVDSACSMSTGADAYVAPSSIVGVAAALCAVSSRDALRWIVEGSKDTLPEMLIFSLSSPAAPVGPDLALSLSIILRNGKAGDWDAVRAGFSCCS